MASVHLAAIQASAKVSIALLKSMLLAVRSIAHDGHVARYPRTTSTRPARLSAGDWLAPARPRTLQGCVLAGGFSRFLQTRCGGGVAHDRWRPGGGLTILTLGGGVVFIFINPAAERSVRRGLILPIRDAGISAARSAHSWCLSAATTLNQQ